MKLGLYLATPGFFSVLKLSALVLSVKISVCLTLGHPLGFRFSVRETKSQLPKQVFLFVSPTGLFLQILQGLWWNTSISNCLSGLWSGWGTKPHPSCLLLQSQSRWHAGTTRISAEWTTRWILMLNPLPKPILSECFCLAAPRRPFGTFKNMSPTHSQCQQHESTADLGDSIRGQSWHWPLGGKLWSSSRRMKPNE